MRKILVTGLIFVMGILFVGNGIGLADEKIDEKKAVSTKNYLKASLELFGVNAVAWIYDWYIQKFGWANVSLDSIRKNVKNGYIWGNNSFSCDQLEHPYHGSMYFASGRVNGFNFWESTVFPFLGSFMWEVLLENNRPSTADGIMTSGGGILLGEPLFRIANDLVIDEGSSGLERIFREISAFIVNPVLGFDRLITGKSFKKEGETVNHLYDLSIPIGISGRNFMAEIQLEYKDALEKDVIKPYDYFTFDLKTKWNKRGLSDREVVTSGILAGKKIKKDLLMGIFGAFDYIDYFDAKGKMSAMGIGPGLIGNFNFGSGLFLNNLVATYGIWGGTTSSFALKYGGDFFDQRGEKYEYGRNGNSWHLGPGILIKTGIEFGKTRFGSIKTTFSHYWLHSIFVDTSESLSILSFDVKYDLMSKIQANAGYDLFLRNARYKDLTLGTNSSVFRTSLIFKF